MNTKMWASLVAVSVLGALGMVLVTYHPDADAKVMTVLAWVGVAIAPSVVGLKLQKGSGDGEGGAP